MYLHSNFFGSVLGLRSGHFSICPVFRENSGLVSFAPERQAPFLSRRRIETDLSGGVSDVHAVCQFSNSCSMRRREVYFLLP